MCNITDEKETIYVHEPNKTCQH